MTTYHLVNHLRDSLTPSGQTLLDGCSDVAAARAEPLFFVGGALRDMLNQPPDTVRTGHTGSAPDLDLALQGDAVALANVVAAQVGATVTAHDRFGTATLKLGDATLDLARTRRERYAQPGALPTVENGAEPVDILDDLARRDFTVNAMALRLGGPNDGELLDPFHGRDDLAHRRIEILHDDSFRDDPTRLLRACRYAARLDARLTRTTRAAAIRDRPYLTSLTPQRFSDAWRLVLNDVAADGALMHARALRLAQTWTPGWSLPPRLLSAYARRAELDVPGATPVEYFWALAALTQPKLEVIDAIGDRCTPLRKEHAALLAGRALTEARASIGRRTTPVSQISHTLRRQSPVAIFAAYILWPGIAGHRVETFMDTWSYVEPPLDASRLLDLGVPQGPAIRVWLDALRDAILDDRLPSGSSAVALAERWIESAAGQPPSRASLAEALRVLAKTAQEGESLA